MSRSGYSDDCDQWQLIRWRGAVTSAIRGRRGQAFLKEMLVAMDALPEPKLIDSDLEREGAVCALGSVGKARGMNLSGLDPYDHETVAVKFGVANALACEIMWENDDSGPFKETPEARFARVRRWIVSQIVPEQLAVETCERFAQAEGER